MRKRYLILTVIAIATMGNTGCPNGAPELKWNPKLYYGDSKSQSLYRQQGDRVHQIYCSNPAFDNRVCVTQKEIVDLQKAYHDLINKCERWK